MLRHFLPRNWVSNTITLHISANGGPHGNQNSILSIVFCCKDLFSEEEVQVPGLRLSDTEHLIFRRLFSSDMPDSSVTNTVSLPPG